MKKWAFISGLSGISWMGYLLYSKSFRLATVTNYPGAFAARWVHYKGIAPSAGTVLAFNVWLVLTSGLEWILLALVVRLALRLGSRSGR